MGTQASRRRGGKVLVVDDDPGVIQILGVNLAHAGFNVISAQDGTEALTRASQEKPDLVLLDIILPDMDGIAVCRQLKEAPPTAHIPVIIISARGDSEHRAAAAAAGAEQYITKPFNPAEIIALVKARLRSIKEDESLNHLTGMTNRV